MRNEKGEAALRPITDAVSEIQAERMRQIIEEGWTSGHDDEHDAGELADAAACYALGQPEPIIRQLWPWGSEWWKPTDKRRNLVKAGALIVAEIERLDRADAGRECPECHGTGKTVINKHIGVEDCPECAADAGRDSTDEKGER